MNLHKRVAEHLPDLKNVVSDRECLAINRKDYAIGEAGPFMAFLNAVRTGFNPAGLADYELFSLALTLSYTKLFTSRTRIVSLSEGTDTIAGAVHYSLWLRGATRLPFQTTGDPTAWSATGPSSTEWLATVAHRSKDEAVVKGCWTFGDYRQPGAQIDLELAVKSGGMGFVRNGSVADCDVANPSPNNSLIYSFFATGHALIAPV